jgi:hypothetical protein
MEDFITQTMEDFTDQQGSNVIDTTDSYMYQIYKKTTELIDDVEVKNSIIKAKLGSLKDTSLELITLHTTNDTPSLDPEIAISGYLKNTSKTPLLVKAGASVLSGIHLLVTLFNVSA